MAKQERVGVVGFTGYSGAELVKILRRHPQVEPVLLEHRSQSADAAPFTFDGVTRLPWSAQSLREGDLSVVLLATPHEVSLELVPMALVGVYGLMAYTVEQRTREVGIRMALGARREEVVRMIVRQGMRVVLAGIVAGLAGALALTRLMDSLLYGVEANDPMTFAAVAIVLSATALLACWRPAVRAARVDPVTALRHE